MPSVPFVSERSFTKRCMAWQMEDINLLGKRDVVTLSTSGGAIVDWSIIGAPQLSQNDMPRLKPSYQREHWRLVVCL